MASFNRQFGGRIDPSTKRDLDWSGLDAWVVARGCFAVGRTPGADFRKHADRMVNLLQLLEQADAQHREGRLDDAEQSYRQILAEVPGESGIRDALAVVLYSAGRRAEAIAELETAIAAQPDQPIFHSHLGVMLRSVGKLAEAIGEFQRALTLDPSLLEARYNQGNAYQQLADYESAAEAYRMALCRRRTIPTSI